MIKRGFSPVRYPGRYPGNYPRRYPVNSRINHFPVKTFPKKTTSSKVSNSTKALAIITVLFMLAVIIFLVVKGFSKDKPSGGDENPLESFTSDLKISNAQLLNYSDINVNIGPPDEEDNVESIIFIFYGEDEKELIRKKVSIENLEELNFDVVFHLTNASKVNKILVIPVFKSESGSEIQGKVEDQFVVKSDVNQTDFEEYPENETFVCKSSAQCNDNNACTTNTCLSNGNCSYAKISNCVPCEESYQCEDLNSCTANRCSDGKCVYLATPGCTPCYSITQCNDNNPCTDNLCFNGRCLYNPISNCGVINNQTNNTTNTTIQCTTSNQATTCNDNNPCTTETCSAGKCVYTSITSCTSNDGCCPEGRGCTLTNDNDCSASCGNNIREATERCDGSDLGGASCAGVFSNSEYTGTLKCSNCMFNTSLCVAPCTQTCNSLGYECGIRMICGKSVNCSLCPANSVCNVNGTCMKVCTSYSYSDCYNGDVYWYNSCGERGSVRYDCSSSQTCTNGVCTDICTTHYSSACYNNDVYWYNSCGVRESIKTDCTSSQTCSNGQCVSSAPSCSNECTSSGLRQCSSSSTYIICGTNYDSDSCLEWSGMIACNSGQTCSGGQCVSSTPNPTIEQADYYVSTSGSDSNPGTIDRPFATLNKVWTVVSAGDLVYVRGGTYRFSTRQRLIGKKGTANNMIRVWAYPGEKPILSKSSSYTSGQGIYFSGDYFHFKGLAISGYVQTSSDESNPGFFTPAIIVENSHYNTFESLDIYNNGFGFWLDGSDGTSTGNLILNCDAHHNIDRLTATAGQGYGGMADGITIRHTNAGTVNTIRGCRMWWNSDDGVDLWANEGMIIIEDSWAFWNGFAPDSFNSAGDGNGFKLGPTYNDGYPLKRKITNNLAVQNKMFGFHDNSAECNMQIYNNFAYQNCYKGYESWCGGFHFSLQPVPFYIKNNIAYDNVRHEADLDVLTNINHNSWDSSVSVSSADFVSLDVSQLLRPRKADGSLPDITFGHLASGSDLIDKGVNVGLPYSGSASDLGAFERE